MFYFPYMEDRWIWIVMVLKQRSSASFTVTHKLLVLPQYQFCQLTS